VLRYVTGQIKDNSLVICPSPPRDFLESRASRPLGIGKRRTSHFNNLMAARKLGGGRVLGSGPPSAPAVAIHQRNSNLLSPSDSPVSPSSQVSNSRVSLGLHDIIPQPPLTNGRHSATAATSPALVCPICNEDMVSQKCSRLVGGPLR